MLDKIKEVGGQLTTKASDAVEKVAATVKGGAETLAGAASGAASSLNEKAIRTAVDQMCTIVQVATDQLRQRPLPDSQVTLTASVNLGVTAVQIQVVLDKTANDNNQ